MRVLVVDDENSLLTTLGANLELEGFDVVEAADGAAALSRLREERFDIVLSDVRMPGMNGVDLYRAIRAIHPHLPVVLMTAFALESLIDQAVFEGVFTVVEKPFEVDELVSTLMRAASRPLVLVVDTKADGDATAAALERVGITCRVEQDVESAIVSVRDDNIDVCILNAALPGDAGERLFGRIRELGAPLAVIALVSASVEDLLQRISHGLFACANAGCPPRELAQLIAAARARPLPPPRGPELGRT